MRVLVSLCALGAAWATAAPARAACTPITTAPFTITQPGNYCFTASLETNISSAAGLEIAADDVTVDLAGFTLKNTYGDTTLAWGIHSYNHRGITIRNGTVQAFFLGIFLDCNSLDLGRDHLIEKMLIVDSTYTGIQMEGLNTIVRDNVIKHTGGPGGHHPNGVVSCENGNGGSIQVLNNVVDSVFHVNDEQSPDGMVLECINTIAIGNRIFDVDDQALAVRGGVCRDNVLQMVAQRPFEAVEGSGGCTLLGKSNFSYP